VYIESKKKMLELYRCFALRKGGDVLKLKNGKPIIDHDFSSAMESIGIAAWHCYVELLITNSFRKYDDILGGVVDGVTPSDMSNHLVGHAIDMNAVYRDENNRRIICNSNCLSQMNPSKTVQCFLTAIKDSKPLRWGVKFNKTNPVRIDDNYNQNAVNEIFFLFLFSSCHVYNKRLTSMANFLISLKVVLMFSHHSV
jgi:hypothetical protein